MRRRWGKAAGCEAGLKATGATRRAHQSSPQRLRCVWMSLHLLPARCWPSAHHPHFHGDGRSAGGVSRAAGCWRPRNWSPLSIQTAHPDCQRHPLLSAEGSTRTWGGQQRGDVVKWGVCHVCDKRERRLLKMCVYVFVLTYMNPEAHRTPQWAEMYPDMLFPQKLWMGWRNDWWSAWKKRKT